MDLTNFQPLELIKLHRDIITELKRREIVRTRNQPIAGYTRWLVKRCYRLNDAGNPNDRHDFIDDNGIKYIVRSRQVNESTMLNAPFSVIRDIEDRNFDFLVIVVYDMDFNIIQAKKITIESLLLHNHYNEHQNGYVLRPNDIESFEIGVEDIRVELNRMVV